MTFPSSPTAAETRLRSHQQEYQDHLPATERVQADLKEDVDVLRAQEGWDPMTAKGVDEWVDDRGAVWRALRRHRYDPDKALSALLATLTHRISLSLHNPPPSTSPYASSPLFQILPIPRFTTRIGQPVVVITLREVKREAQGGLEEMKEWTWWALEMVRRVLNGWWIKGDFDDETGRGKSRARGLGGEGCVLVIDAEGAGYRNLEVELLPTLLSVGHNHFPGVFDSVHVVNAGWTHRSMWTVVKRILPRSALEKVNFLDSPRALEGVFNLDKLPQCYGGTDPWTFTPENNTILQYCSRHTRRFTPSPQYAHSPILPIASRSASSTSLADIFYTAQNTPIDSRPPTRPSSRRGSVSGLGLAGTNALNDFRMTSTLRRTRSTDHAAEVKEIEGRRKPYARRPSSVTQPQTPLQRIKSLSDFHLYLSPSRLANLDVLSDSDSDSDMDPPTPLVLDPPVSPGELPTSPPVDLPRRVLRPVVVDPEATISLRSRSLADRRSRPPLRLIGVRGLGKGDEECVRSYSDRLSLHHAHILREYQKSPPVIAAEELLGSEPEAPAELITPELQHAERPRSPAVTNDAKGGHIERVSAYSRSLNPWFGYPAVRLSPTSRPHNAPTIIPLYTRNRKRDLVKTLLFLFMLRLQSARDSVERWFGLHHLGAIPWSRRWEGVNVKGPDEGLRMQEHKTVAVDVGVWGGWRKRGEWVWLIICLVLFRGGWSRVLGGLLGYGWGGEGVREVLGW